MDDSDQLGEASLSGQAANTEQLAARAGGGKPRTKEVKARYLQAKPTPAARHPASSLNSTGRPSLAAYQSAGWVELQLPNHASTPLMMHTGGASSAVFTQSKPKRLQGQPTPAPGTAQQRALLQTAQQQRLQHQRQTQTRQTQMRQQQQQQQKPPAGSASHPAAQPQQQATPAAAAAAAELPQAALQQPQQQHQHDVAPMPDTARRRADTAVLPQLQQQGANSALISPGSSRSSTSCSFRPGSEALDADLLSLHASRHLEQQTPQANRLVASMGAPDTILHLAKFGMSADVASAVHGGRTADKGAAMRRAQLEAYRQQRKLQQQQQQQAKGMNNIQGSFKEPQPKTMFKATAASMGSTKALQPATTAAVAATPVAGAGAPAMLPASSPASSSVSGTAASMPAGSPASAFKATMATLQQTGSGSKPGRPSSGGSRSGSKASRPSGVPALQMDWLHSANTTTPARAEPGPPHLGRSPAPASATKIPSLDLSTLGQQRRQQHEPLSVPLTSRRISNAANVPLPDATPRTIRDAPPSRLPKTPRASTAGVPEGDDVAAARHAAPPAAAPVVPGLKLGSLAGSGAAGAVGAGSLSSRLKSTAVPTKTPRMPVNSARDAASARGSLTPPSASSHNIAAATTVASSRRPAGSGSSAATTDRHIDQTRPSKTPRGLVKTAAAGLTGASSAACGAAATPQLVSSSSVSAGAVPTARKGDQERADEVRQQLRLLKLQHLQLRHLNARLAMAMKAKKEKANDAVAAAALAVIHLSGELMALKSHLQQEQWHSELAQVLQRQLPKLREWARLQAQGGMNVSQLQVACSAALSHVPLLNGAVVGHHPELPDLELLQRQLVHGMQLLQEVQPALQQLLGPDLAAAVNNSNSRSSSSSPGAAADAGSPAVASGPAAQGSSQSSNKQQEQDTAHAHNSIKTTAALAEQLMRVAAEECELLQQLAQQLAALSDLHLYANSMQVQLVQMKQVAEAPQHGC